MIRVSSGWSPLGRTQYGERFLASFDRYWPEDVQLQVYVEEPMPMPRGACRSLWDIAGATEFHTRHAGDLAVQGREVQPSWKPKEVQRGYSFRFDGYKFWKQLLIPGAAASDLSDGDILVWMDGDVETIAPVPAGFVEELIGDAEVCYINRSRQHSEIGFWAVRINGRTRTFLHDIAQTYRTDRFRSLAEWHSAYVWDEVRAGSGMSERTLCRPGLHGHVWPMTALARYTVHRKGDRKGEIK